LAWVLWGRLWDLASAHHGRVESYKPFGDRRLYQRLNQRPNLVAMAHLEPPATQTESLPLAEALAEDRAG
jgi:hypothetical protein